MSAGGSDVLRLEMRGITKVFPGTVACEAIDFDLCVGEIHALVGQNGAGKSTLIRVLAGIYPRDAGEIFIEGEPVEHLTPWIAHDLGMRFIHQELNLVPQFNEAVEPARRERPRRSWYFYRPPPIGAVPQRCGAMDGGDCTRPLLPWPSPRDG